MRTASSGRSVIEHPRRGRDLIPEVAAEVAARAKVDRAAEQLAECQLEFREPEQAGYPPRREGREEVHVAVGAVGIAKRGTEEGERGDPVRAAERREFLLVDVDPSGNAHDSSVA